MRSFYIFAINLMLILPLYPASGQDSPQENPASGQSAEGSRPQVIGEQPYKYYYWPEVNLNNFGLSTLGNGQGGNTMGRSLKRKSNLEVNSPQQPEKSSRYAEESPGMVFSPEGEDIDSETVIEEEAPRTPASEKPIYEWVDEQGTLHITNNIGDVPLKYLKDIRKQQEPLKKNSHTSQFPFLLFHHDS
jgi:hypothetical protein